MGYISTVKGANDCGSFSETQLLSQRGVKINAGMTFRSSPIIEVHLKTLSSATVDGARVGMTIAQVKAIYGARYKVNRIILRHPKPTDEIVTLCNPGDKWEPNGD